MGVFMDLNVSQTLCV